MNRRERHETFTRLNEEGKLSERAGWSGLVQVLPKTENRAFRGAFQYRESSSLPLRSNQTELFR